RKTLGFSKNRRELQHALEYIDAHANFIKPHQSLRQRASPDSGRRWVPRTSAMAAGLTDHRWTLEELLCYKP
ncbi:MAG: transposase, partial [candidate division NC10 bacterium]